MLNQLMDESLCGITEELWLIITVGNAFVDGLTEWHMFLHQFLKLVFVAVFSFRVVFVHDQWRFGIRV